MDDQEKELIEAKKEDKKDDKNEKDKNEKKGNRVVRYFREVKEELFKVEWPKRKDVIRGTGIVIVLSVFVAVVLGFSDYVFSSITQFILETY
ncbi:preprotein translocase subunit SecE [Patescibacteria group bacterium]